MARCRPANNKLLSFCSPHLPSPPSSQRQCPHEKVYQNENVRLFFSNFKTPLSHTKNVRLEVDFSRFVFGSVLLLVVPWVGVDRWTTKFSICDGSRRKCCCAREHVSRSFSERRYPATRSVLWFILSNYRYVPLKIATVGFKFEGRTQTFLKCWIFLSFIDDYFGITS